MSVDVKISSRWNIICDFDGTIAPTDVTDHLLERFADPAWLQIERAWQAQEISSRHCLMQQTEMLSMTAGELLESLADIPIDPAFVDFVAFAQSRDCGVQVASEGYAQAIRTLLGRAGAMPLAIASTYLIANGADRWMLGCPFARPNCRSVAATCKCAVAGQGVTAGARTLLIGDGRSDFCLAARADFVFARGALLDYCRQRHLPHAPVGNFVDAQQQLVELLAMDMRSNNGVLAEARVQRHG